MQFTLLQSRFRNGSYLYAHICGKVAQLCEIVDICVEHLPKPLVIKGRLAVRGSLTVDYVHQRLSAPGQRFLLSEPL